MDINVMSNFGHKQVWGRANTTKDDVVADVAVQMLPKQDKGKQFKKIKIVYFKQLMIVNRNWM